MRFVIRRQEMNETILNFTNEFISDLVKQQEKIIKEAAEQGHNYLVLKENHNYDLENFKITTTAKYQTFDTLEEIKRLGIQDYKIYVLSKVREYLKEQK